jgi:hypothetical protein
MYCMNSSIQKQKIKHQNGIRPIHSHPNSHYYTATGLADGLVFLQYVTYVYYMILLSKKMTPQTFLDEIIMVPYNKPLGIWSDMQKQPQTGSSFISVGSGWPSHLSDWSF